MKIPVAKPYLSKEEAKAAYDVILTGWVTQGPKVEQFEKDFSAYVGSRYAVAVSSCTTGLHLCMLMADVRMGDEVICPSLSYVATANSIKYAGGIPVFAEVNEEYNLDIEDVKKKITPKTKAILLVHQIGMPADIEPFQKLCEEHSITLIEDAACAIGSSYKEKKIGSHSDLVCFSFHPRKVITTGDGGMITTSNPKIAEKLKLLRQHGMDVNDRKRHLSKTLIIPEHVVLGYNYRMTDIQAAIGIEQLKRLDDIIKQRRSIAMQYHQHLSKYEFLMLPIEQGGKFSNYQSYSVFLKEEAPISRDDLINQLLEKGISTRSGVMTAHREKVYTDMGYEISLPHSERLCDQSIVLPLYVPMAKQEIEYVLEQLDIIFHAVEA